MSRLSMTDADAGLRVSRHGGHEDASWYATSLGMTLHGAFMVLAWLFCNNLGIAVGRYLRQAPRPYNNWFPLHYGSLGVGSLFALVGFIIILCHVGSGGDGHFTEPHSVMGLIVILLMLGQIGLGVASHFTWNPQAGKASVIDQWHWWIGRGVYLLAVATVITGFFLLGSEMAVNGAVWFFFGTLIAWAFISVAAVEIHVFQPPATPHQSFEVLGGEVRQPEARLGSEIDPSNERLFKVLTINVIITAVLTFAVIIGLFTGVSYRDAAEATD